MNPLPATVNHTENLALAPEEERLVQTLRLLRRLESSTQDQVERFVWSLVGRYLKWSYSDPSSLERALQFAALDPFLRQEVEAINAEFTPADADGLEAY